MTENIDYMKIVSDEDMKRINEKKKELDNLFIKECNSDPFDSKFILFMCSNLDHFNFSYFVDQTKRKCTELSISAQLQQANPFSAKENSETKKINNLNCKIKNLQAKLDEEITKRELIEKENIGLKASIELKKEANAILTNDLTKLNKANKEAKDEIFGNRQEEYRYDKKNILETKI